MATRVLRVLPPYESYDFGQGVVVSRYGTVIDDAQLAIIQARMATLKPKLCPRVQEILGVGLGPVPETTYATEAWVQDQLDGLGAGSGDVALNAHVNSPTPHPEYDDIQDVVVLFENGIV